MEYVVIGTCNERALFIDINVGQPGRMHDARVFRLSPLYQRLTDPVNPILRQDMHLIGDSAYPLLTNLMKPYQDNGHLTREQHIFNNKLSSVRSTIERAFGLLKIKFRRLKYIDIHQAESAMHIVCAACVLHNFILLQNNDADDYNVDNIDIANLDNYNFIEGEQEERSFAERKRRYLVNACNREA